MQNLEKILEEIENERTDIDDYSDAKSRMLARHWNSCIDVVEDIIRKHMNDGWISVEQKPKKDYIAVLAVDKHDYYFVAVYDKEHGFRSNDIGADIDNIVAYCLFYPYRPERSDNHDGE